MIIAKFVNFTSQPYVGHWNGKKKTFAPGQSLYLEAGIAAVLAKHLANRELLKMGKENMTSPKKPEEVPDFMELYKQAFIPQENEETDEFQDRDEFNSNLINRNRTAPEAPKPVALPEGAQGLEKLPPQVIAGPDGGAGDEDDYAPPAN